MGGMGGAAGGGNPFGSMNSGAGNQNPFASAGGMGQRPGSGSSKPPIDVVKPLPLTLAELYSGVTKKLKITKSSGTTEVVVVCLFHYYSILLLTNSINRSMSKLVGKMVLKSDFLVLVDKLMMAHRRILSLSFQQKSSQLVLSLDPMII